MLNFANINRDIKYLHKRENDSSGIFSFSISFLFFFKFCALKGFLFFLSFR